MSALAFALRKLAADLEAANEAEEYLRRAPEGGYKPTVDWSWGRNAPICETLRRMVSAHVADMLPALLGDAALELRAIAEREVAEVRQMLEDAER